MKSDQTTIDGTTTMGAPEPARGLTVTLLWHPDPSRIGRMAAVEFGQGGVHLSRLSPVFDDGEPLADVRVSRTPIQLIPRADGGVEVWPGREGMRYTLDGQPGVGGDRLDADALARGVRLAFGRDGALALLESGLRAADAPRHGLVGPSATLTRARTDIDHLGPRPFPVLVSGPTGTGKEVVSKALHATSLRSKQRLLAINMAALSTGTLQSQLFGHTRGAFTGAERASGGYFGRAEGGTIFLDEIGACPPDVQAQLLRALESGEVQPVGGDPRRIDVRVLAATDEDLHAAVAEGRFRSALYHRLAHGHIQLTPLATRPADIAAQLVYFLRAALEAEGHPNLLSAGAGWLGRGVVEALLDRPWPGNTRELKAAAEQLVLRCAQQPRCAVAPEPSRPPRPEYFEQRTPSGDPSSAPGAGSPDDIEEALARSAYRIDAAAKRLGMSRNTLRKRMAQMGLPRPRDLNPSQIQATLADTGGDLQRAAQRLKVSTHGLRLRCRELGIAASR